MTQSLRPLIAGNWKMHGTTAFASGLAGSLADKASAAGNNGVDMLLCPPSPLIATVRAAIGESGIALGGQDCHAAEQGAHTGDISATMLADTGCSYVIVGHSEQRADHAEDDAVVKQRPQRRRQLTWCLLFALVKPLRSGRPAGLSKW